jgi:lantibiotic biosynthesis protein
LGLSGIAIFAARRKAVGRGTKLSRLILDRFDSLIQAYTGTGCWSTPQGSVYRLNKHSTVEPEYNLGLAHGIPGVIAALIPFLRYKDTYNKAAELIIHGCNWLLLQERSLDFQSRFVCCVGDSEPSRLGWCYGDLTIALTLARAGKALESDLYMQKARQIALHSSLRDVKSAMVRDAGLCHGSAGLSLIFQLINEIIPEQEFKDASDYWLEYTLTAYRTDGLEGFYAYKKGSYVETFGVLEGYAGIGLCLLSKAGVSTRWAEGFLLV